MNADWKKSSYSGKSSNCVETRVTEMVDVRDTQNRQAGHLTVPRAEWAALVVGVRSDR